VKRLYYLADNLDVAEQIADVLHSAGISAWDFHVMSQDADGLCRHHLHSATPLHRRGIMRGSERGALCGFLLGLAASIAIVVFGRLAPAQSLIAFAAVTFAPMLIGSWMGSTAGHCVQKQRLAMFKDDLEQGRAVLIVDVDRVHFTTVQTLMQQFAVQLVHRPSILMASHLRCTE